MRRFVLPLVLALVCATTQLVAQHVSAQFDQARPKDDKFFQVAVWLQSPHNAKRYRDIGVNLFVGLYHGPTAEQLEVALGPYGLARYRVSR